MKLCMIYHPIEFLYALQMYTNSVTDRTYMYIFFDTLIL